MSRIAKQPVSIENVEISLDDSEIRVKGSKGELTQSLHPLVNVEQADNELKFSPAKNTRKAVAMSGTLRSLINNMVQGVKNGFEIILELKGVGYRAQVNGSKVVLSLGFSHPVNHVLPPSVTAEMPDNTTLVLKSIDKQLLGQVAANIRSYRPPEPYKGKGVRYRGEHVVMKETKKK